jgi:lysophospholipase L1-like esterase
MNMRPLIAGQGKSNLALLALVMWLAGVDEAPARDGVTLLLGDSIAHDYGDTIAYDYGDSITHDYRIKTICGQPVVNAAWNGARAIDVAARTTRFIKLVEPALVVVLVGANDVEWLNTAERLDAWRSYYEAIVRDARRAGAAVIVVPIPPVKGAEPLNDRIKTLARAWRIRVAAPTYQPGHLLDRVGHLTRSGYAVLHRAIEKACP